jgi:demethylmenaquinone methyltransferase/2-methoxy-6-polyprenyl-1,4-benzoquinol methylase
VTKTYEQRNERFFRFWAPVYDGIEWFVGGFRRKLVALAQVRKDDRVLDVACGTGSLSFELEKHGAIVTGVDVSPHMLRVARRKLKRLQRKREVRLTVIQHDARHLPFPDGSFDASTISFALHDMPEDVQVSVLREMRRTTKPRGPIVIGEYRKPKNPVGRFLAHLFISSYETRYYRRFMRGDLEKTLQQAGLSILKEQRIINGMGRLLLVGPDSAGTPP